MSDANDPLPDSLKPQIRDYVTAIIMGDLQPHIRENVKSLLNGELQGDVKKNVESLLFDDSEADALAPTMRMRVDKYIAGQARMWAAAALSVAALLGGIAGWITKTITENNQLNASIDVATETRTTIDTVLREEKERFLALTRITQQEFIRTQNAAAQALAKAEASARDADTVANKAKMAAERSSKSAAISEQRLAGIKNKAELIEVLDKDLKKAAQTVADSPEFKNAVKREVLEAVTSPVNGELVINGSLVVKRIGIAAPNGAKPFYLRGVENGIEFDSSLQIVDTDNNKSVISPGKIALDGHGQKTPEIRLNNPKSLMLLLAQETGVHIHCTSLDDQGRTVLRTDIYNTQDPSSSGVKFGSVKFGLPYSVK